jgi:hypothetical protein
MAKRAPNSREQLALVEGLHDVVVGAEQKPCDSVIGLSPVTRQEDDRDVAAVPIPQVAANLIAAHLGEVDVEQDERRLHVARRLERLASVLRLTRLIARALEQTRDPAASTGISIDNKDRAARTYPPPQVSEFCEDLLTF